MALAGIRISGEPVPSLQAVLGTLPVLRRARQGNGVRVRGDKRVVCGRGVSANCWMPLDLPLPVGLGHRQKWCLLGDLQCSGRCSLKLFWLTVVFLIPLLIQAQTVSTKSSPDEIPYALAPMDRIVIHAPHAPNLNGRSFQIQPDGIVILPSLGRIQAAGLTTSELEKTLAARISNRNR